MAEVLVIDDVTKRFGDFAAVDHMNLTMKEGQISLLVGPNGCGKSTLVNCISGYYVPNEGGIYFDDRGDAVAPFIYGSLAAPQRRAAAGEITRRTVV